MGQTVSGKAESMYGTSSGEKTSQSLVVDGAKVECKEGEKAATLMGNFTVKKIDVGEKDALTISNTRTKEKNFGICKKLTKKAEKKQRKKGNPNPTPSNVNQRLRENGLGQTQLPKWMEKMP